MPDPASSNLFSSHDVDETRAHLSEALGRRIEIQPLQPAAFDARISSCTAGPLRIVSASYAHGLERKSSDVPDNISLSIMKLGSASLQFRKSSIDLKADDTVIYNSSMLESARFDPGAANCFLTFPKKEIEKFSEKIFDRRLPLPADIGVTLLRDTLDTRTIASLATMIEGILALEPSRAKSSHGLRLLCEAVMMSIVEAIPDHRKWFDAAPARPASWQIRQAVDFIAAQTGPVTIHDVARTAGIGVRALQIAFQEQLGVTPQAYLKRTRLEAVRAALRRPVSGRTVGEIARMWGFLNMTRFVNEYEQAFGVTPGWHTLKSR